MTEPLARIEAALKGLGAEHEPPVGWQSRVLAATTTRKSPKWWWFAAPAVAVAVVVVVVVFGGPPDEHGLELALTFDQGNVIVRGDSSAHAGDVVHATATRAGPFYAVWIYRDDMLVMACPGAMQCRVTSKAITADATLMLGKYTIVALRSDAPLPPPKGRFDADLARASEAGATAIPKRLTVH